MPGGPHCGKGRHVVLGLGEREGCGDQRGDQHEQPGDKERDEQDQPEWVLVAALDLEKIAVAESVGHGTLYLRGDRAGGRGEVERLGPDRPAESLGRVRQDPGAVRLPVVEGRGPDPPVHHQGGDIGALGYRVPRDHLGGT